MTEIATDAARRPEHPKHLAHQFETPTQQFESGKLGMWLFLTTEILLFSGLFCAYSVYRANHPEVFYYAHLYLSKPLGAINTMVLILSSFTMASAVRAAQLGNRRSLVGLLIVTLVCGFVFLGIKGIEYKDKWEEGLLTGGAFRPEAPPPGAIVPQSTKPRPSVAPGDGVAVQLPPQHKELPSRQPVVAPIERSTIAPAAVGPPGISPQWLSKKPAHPWDVWVGPEPSNVQVFFGVYFAMTGLHAVHVLVGMAVIGWILRRAVRGDFGPTYFTPVDFTGLYWHLVDLIWIFLFPLLYLIA
jgi:cytochrome c oxidase subunit III